MTSSPASSVPSRDVDDLLCIIALGIAVRESQKFYFATKLPAALAKSKVLERQFDARAARALDPASDLFGGPNK